MKSKIYNVLDISCYVINYSNQKKYDISNLKLQYLLYFIQAYFLIDKKIPCFDSQIEARDCGIVVPEVFYEYRFFGSCNILFQNVSVSISRKDEKRIKQVIDLFSNCCAADLMKIAFSQSPWKTFYKEGHSIEIPVDFMQEYFN